MSSSRSSPTSVPGSCWFGQHDNSAATANIYDELYALMGLAPREAQRTKPPCCEETDLLPPILDSIIDSILDRADRVRRTRRGSLADWFGLFVE